MGKFDKKKAKQQLRKLEGWVADLTRHDGEFKDPMAVWEDVEFREADHPKRTSYLLVGVYVFDNLYRYSISAYLTGYNSTSYLGCILTQIKGHKGSDLPDGDFSQKTWDEIVKAIAACALRGAPKGFYTYE